jgi:phosphoserine phosphatase
MSDDHLRSAFVLVVTARAFVSDDSFSDITKKIAEFHATSPITNRLGDGALEFSLSRNDDALLRALREQFIGAGMDFNIVPGLARKKKLLLADMDATLIVNECIDELACATNNEAQVRDVTARTMAGEIEFCQSLRDRVALLKGVATTVLKEVLDQRIKLSPGAEILGRTLAKHGVATAVVSGGFTYFTDHVAKMTGFGQAFSNTLEFKNGALTGLIKEPVMGPEAKRAVLETLCRENKLDPTQTLCVGDGANDIPMLRAAGLGVAYRAKPGVGQNANASIKYADLTALLYLQGYHQAEFAAPHNTVKLMRGA